MSDLTLLFGCFVKFRGFVILQAALENCQNFRGGFSGGANAEGAVELLFAGAIAFGEAESSASWGENRLFKTEKVLSGSFLSIYLRRLLAV